MTQPMTPREKVAEIVESAILRHFPSAVISDTLDDASDILTALSGSGDHAELARLAERCTTGDPWYKEGDLRGRQTFEQFLPQDRAFIAAANPATVLALIAENAALRASVVKANDGFEEYERRFYLEQDRATEAERKLAEADQVIREISETTQITRVRHLARTFLSSTEAERG